MSVATIEIDEKLMSADEFWALPTSRRQMELVRGRIVTIAASPPFGFGCGRWGGR